MCLRRVQIKHHNVSVTSHNHMPHIIFQSDIIIEIKSMLCIYSYLLPSSKNVSPLDLEFYSRLSRLTLIANFNVGENMLWSVISE